jgi:putative flippase GtrA
VRREDTRQAPRSLAGPPFGKNRSMSRTPQTDKSVGSTTQTDASGHAHPASRPRPGVARNRASRLQVGRFVAVGALNTLVDYVLFIGLTKTLHLALSWVWVAKLVSGTVAITLSFVLNRHWVFRAKGRARPQAVRFVATTVFAVYAIQTPLTQLFANTFTWPGRTLYDLLHGLGFPQHLPSVFTEPLAIKTAAFLLATVVSMVFNFVVYRRWVFRTKD